MSPQSDFLRFLLSVSLPRVPNLSFKDLSNASSLRSRSPMLLSLRQQAIAVGIVSSLPPKQIPRSSTSCKSQTKRGNVAPPGMSGTSIVSSPPKQIPRSPASCKLQTKRGSVAPPGMSDTTPYRILNATAFRRLTILCGPLMQRTRMSPRMSPHRAAIPIPQSCLLLSRAHR